MKSNKYAVGEEWMIFDEQENKWVEGTITEVGDETFCIKWQDLSEETEYRIDDAPRIFPANADKGINHPLYEVLRKFIQDYPSVAPSLHQVDRWENWEEQRGAILHTAKRRLIAQWDNDIRLTNSYNGNFHNFYRDRIAGALLDVFKDWQPLPAAPGIDKNT